MNRMKKDPSSRTGVCSTEVSFAASDGPDQTQTVTITATDSILEPRTRSEGGQVVEEQGATIVPLFDNGGTVDRRAPQTVWPSSDNTMTGPTEVFDTYGGMVRDGRSTSDDAALLRPLFHPHQVRLAQRLEMLGDGRGRQFELIRDVAGTERASCQHLDDALAGRVGEGGEMHGHALLFHVSLN